jgi:hypothetical protein
VTTASLRKLKQEVDIAQRTAIHLLEQHANPTSLHAHFARNQAIRQAAELQILTPKQIRQATQISRQRYNQIIAVPTSSPAPKAR